MIFLPFHRKHLHLSCQLALVQIDKLTSNWREQQTASSPINPRKTGRSLRGWDSKHLICQFQSLFHCRHFCCARKHSFCPQAAKHTLENQVDFCRAVLQHHFLSKKIFASRIWSVIMCRVWKGLLAKLGDFFAWNWDWRCDVGVRTKISAPACSTISWFVACYPACVLRALGLLLADGAPTVGRGKTF